MDCKLELAAVPVSDVDRAKRFYTEQAGFNPDHDHTISDEIRFVQLTPPGSACSIAIGRGIVDAPGLCEVQSFGWGRFVFFRDPDGNGWALQESMPGA